MSTDPTRGEAAPREARRAERARATRRAATLSLAVGVTLLVVKLIAWRLTGSTAVLSDALETIVNVVAAGFGLFAVRLAHRPADRGHPYGHGKIEFIAAGFEGALILVAALWIVVEAVEGLVRGAELQRLGAGLVLVAAAASVNGVLGLWLIRTGRRHDSATLVADGKHLMTDVVTSVASLLALGLVLVTGATWWDPALALVAAGNIGLTAVRLLRESVGGLMDEADVDDLGRIRAALEALDEPLLVGWARVRARHQGWQHHVDLTIFVPDATPVRQAHALADRVEAAIVDALADADVLCHVEPASLAPPPASPPPR